MTLLPDAKLPLECLGNQWHAVITPQPPNDRWLSFGQPMKLHGEGLRNPDVASGAWTATPQDAESQCRARSSALWSARVRLARRRYRKVQADNSFHFACCHSSSRSR
jgi:hypothetical protein